MHLQQNIQIHHPCPIPLSKLKSNGSDFYCKGCSKSVIDFRGKSKTEIRSACASGNVCGVFDNNQLTNQGQYSGLNLFLFRFLAVIALLGINVSPLKAQVFNSGLIQQKKLIKELKNIELDKKTSNEDEKQTQAKNKYYLFNKKKKRSFRTIGCPSF